MTRVLFELVPYAGPALAAAFDRLFAPASRELQRRWLDQLANVVNDLQARGIDVHALASDPSFYALVRRATDIAARTEREEKLGALRQALVNVTTQPLPEDYDQVLFAKLDAISVTGLYVLWDLRRAVEMDGLLFGDVATQFAVRRKDDDLFKQAGEKTIASIVRDLHSTGLLTSRSRPMQGGGRAFKLGLTELGADLLKLVLPPDRAKSVFPLLDLDEWVPTNEPASSLP